MTRAVALVGLLLLLLEGRSVLAQEAQRLLCLDRDARAASPKNAGAVFNLSATNPEARVFAEVAATFNARELEYLGGITSSLSLDLVFFSDYRAGTADPGRIWSMRCGAGEVELAFEDIRLKTPLGLASLDDGTILLLDADADPAGLGADSAGGEGPGALYRLDPSAGSISLVADGSSHEPLPGVSASAFQEPVAVAVDESGTAAWVLDALADPLNDPAAPRPPYRGALYRVDLATGMTTLIATDSRFGRLSDLDRLPDGRLIVVDGLAGNSRVWVVDPDGADPERNATKLSGGRQYSELAAVSVDAAGQVFVSDLGAWDRILGEFLVAPAIFRIDDAIGDPEANALLVSRSPRLVTPVGLVAEPSCAAPEGTLLIGRPVSVWSVPSAFSPSCITVGFRFCGEEFAPIEDDRFPLALLGEGMNSITFMEHADNGRLLLVREGDDLVVSVD